MPRRAGPDRFLALILADATMTAAYRGEAFEHASRWEELRSALVLAGRSDAYAAQVCYRAACSLRRLHLTPLARAANTLAAALAQVQIADEVTVGAGLYLAHGQVTIEGPVTLGPNVVMFPWSTIRAEGGPLHVETDVRVGTGAVIEGSFTVGAAARVGANAVVTGAVPPGAVVAGNPAAPVTSRPADDPSRASGYRRRPDASGTSPGAPREGGSSPMAASSAPAIRLPDGTTRKALLESARAAEREDRLVDAIDHYTIANRLLRSPNLDSKLVRLRHRAFREVQATAQGPEAWPRKLDDPYPEGGIPEIDAADVTTEAIGGAIVNHGCVIVRGLVDEATTAHLRETIDQALEIRQRVIDGGELPPESAYAPLDLPDCDLATERIWVEQVGGMLAADAPGVFFDVLDRYHQAGVMRAIEQYLGEAPALSFNKFVLRKVRESAPTWHQDGSFIGADVRAVDVWLSLSDCGGDTDTIGLDIVPRRFDDLLEHTTHGATFPFSIGQGLIDIVAPGEMATPRFHPGDAILFDDRFVHRSSFRDGLVGERYAVEAWFFAPSHFPTQYVPIVA